MQGNLLWTLSWCLSIAAGGGIASAWSQEAAPRDEDLFEVVVHPTLTAKCLRCHGENEPEAGLNLTVREGLLRGGESGAALVPGRPEESLLWEALSYQGLEMPPDGRLEDSVLDGVRRWIAAGAPWPEDSPLRAAPAERVLDRDWWCFQPIARPQPPVVQDQGWARNEIDRFIFARLAEAGVVPASEAAAGELRRRAAFAVTGLPPDNSAAEMTYEAFVDLLLESPAFGENQARYWLDLVRYAESDGYRADAARPEASLYRDYVIRSFNDDKPYSDFIKEQLAGDELRPGDRDAIIATMFLRHWIYEHNQRDVETQWSEILSDITETTADAFLALGVKCARCHDHKFDPLLQQDYYRLQAFFAAFQPHEALPVADLPARAQYLEQLRAWETATAEIRRRLHAIEHPVLLRHATREGFDKFVPEIKQMILKPDAERSPYERQIASLASRQFDVHPDKLPEWLDPQQEAERQELRRRLAEFNALQPEPLPTMKFVAGDIGPEAPPTFIPDKAPPQPIAPGFPTLLDDGPAEITPPPPALQSTGRRTALAEWIASPSNPLTARVIVNRVWQQHFGRGLVETTSDFGKLGDPPSHPELLDWLASWFIDNGWRLKPLHRLILTSATYRQTSHRLPDETLRRLDPGNTLLWRMNPRRLSGEEIHDAVLTAAEEDVEKRRAIYKPVLRNKLDPLLAAFDFPDRIRSTGRRHRTTTSTQALMLLNNDWTNRQAEAIARRLEEQDDVSFIREGYRRLFSREPAENEAALAVEFLRQYAANVPPSQPESPLTSMPHAGPALDWTSDAAWRVQAGEVDGFPGPHFTVEAVVLLRSLYPDATVRTIAAQWTGNKEHPGWALGVTSTKSAYKPRHLILQLVGRSADDKPTYEVVASGLHLELNKPYYAAVSVNLGDPSPSGVTFVLEDLSASTGPLVAQAGHAVVAGLSPAPAVQVGGRFGGHLWDGLIQRVRLRNESIAAAELGRTALAEANAGSRAATVLDLTFAAADELGRDQSGQGRHARIESLGEKPETPGERARVAWLHALLNSNELIYVD